MKVIDIIFALICGKVIGFVFGGLLEHGNISLGIYGIILFWIIFPLFSVFCLWLAQIIGRKFLFVYQVAKHVLVGAFATVVDLKLFNILIFLSSVIFSVNTWATMTVKGISFIVSTTIKYFGNKYWAFEKHDHEELYKEVLQFIFTTGIGLIIDVGIFYYFTKVLGPQFGLSQILWIELSVLIAAIIAGIWNFLGYKFLVFKK